MEIKEDIPGKPRVFARIYTPEVQVALPLFGSTIVQAAQDWNSLLTKGQVVPKTIIESVFNAVEREIERKMHVAQVLEDWAGDVIDSGNAFIRSDGPSFEEMPVLPNVIIPPMYDRR